jgi:hypothetical protein
MVDYIDNLLKVNFVSGDACFFTNPDKMRNLFEIIDIFYRTEAFFSSDNLLCL